MWFVDPCHISIAVLAHLGLRIYWCIKHVVLGNKTLLISYSISSRRSVTFGSQKTVSPIPETHHWLPARLNCNYCIRNLPVRNKCTFLILHVSVTLKSPSHLTLEHENYELLHCFTNTFIEVIYVVE